MLDPAGRGLEVAGRVLGVEADLDRVAAGDDVLLRERERLARRDQDLCLDQVNAGHHLGNGVLDLDPRVDLDEVDSCPLAVDDEFDRRRIGVVGRADQPARGLAHLDARLVRDAPAGAFFDQLLVPPLG